MTDAPSGAHVHAPADARRMVKLSEFNAIHWNRNPKDYRDGSVKDLSDLVRAEGKKIPRSVIIDDPEAPDYGKIYFTRPRLEAKERAISKLLVVHGLDWEAMQLDHERNVFSWSRGELRRRTLKILTKRLKAPPKVLFKHERRALPRLRQLKRLIDQEKVDKKLYLQQSQQAIEDIQRRNVFEIKQLDSSGGDRVLQLQESRQYLDTWFHTAGAKSVGALEGGEALLGGEEIAVNGMRLIMGLDLKQSKPSELKSSDMVTEAIAEGQNGEGVVGGGQIVQSGAEIGGLEGRMTTAGGGGAEWGGRGVTGLVLGSKDVDVRDRRALVAAAAQSGVAVELEGPVRV